MAYQLRRVIAINIIAARTGLPSSRVAILDVRGKVLAVGINGVGKTTFLRTIPLFYGATPKEILKRTFKGSMIGYTLPSASSAIAYEYERTNEDDLRCAVMFRRPNEDEAVFYIMRSGYDESFFVDENDQFVDAPTFKARAEAAGVWVSQALRMHQYRSVILREKPLTKEGTKLRELALEHSLGPTTLTNMGPIAAAISTEKINFDDLKRIVVDRVAEEMGDVAGDGVLAQKPIREDLKRWLETRDHMAAILALKPKAENLKALAEALRKRHMELCTLHVAVKKTILRCEQRQGELAIELADLAKNADEAMGGMNAEIQTLRESLGTSRGHMNDLEIEITRIENQIKHFESLKIVEVEALASTQDALQEQLKSTQAQLDELTNTAKDANLRASERHKAITAAHNSTMIALGKRREEFHSQHGQALESLRLEAEAARKQLRSPKELDDLGGQLLQLQREKGSLENQILSPHASVETVNALSLAETQVVNAESQVGDKEAKEKTTIAEQQTAKKAADDVAAQLLNVTQTIDKAHANLQRLQAQLTPAEGTLLAFLRSHEESTWSGSARVLHQALIHRTDLEPDFDALTGETTPGRVSIGALSLDVNQIETPSWVSETELKHEIALQEQALQDLRGTLAQTQTATSTKAKAFKAANDAASAASAQVVVAKNVLHAARAERNSLAQKAADEKNAAADVARSKMEEVTEK